MHNTPTCYHSTGQKSLPVQIPQQNKQKYHLEAYYDQESPKMAISSLEKEYQTIYQARTWIPFSQQCRTARMEDDLMFAMDL